MSVFSQEGTGRRGVMAEKIVINPFTRISGFMEIVVIIENGIVIDAKSKGLMFRGFEKMLIGRNPFDAVYFTERICGICSTAHAVASSMALEKCLEIIPSEQGRYLRDIIHGCEFLQNHIRHFYQFTIPGFIKLPQNYSYLQSSENDFRLPKNINNIIAEHYFDSLEFSRNAHQMLAILGGKAPHNHGAFIGGITTQATADKIIGMKSILDGLESFIDEKMIPDVYKIAGFYPELYEYGGGNGNFLTYGCFSGYKELGTLYVNPSVYYDNILSDFYVNEITEESYSAWYKDNYNKNDRFVDIDYDVEKPNAYSWIKTAKYKNMFFEVGPLARQWCCGAYRRGISAMDRIIARVLEAKKIAVIIKTLLNNLKPNVNLQQKYEIPKSARGAGLIDTTRGALGHWISIEDRLIKTYQIITPSVWNLSPQGTDNKHGPVEQALIGAPVRNTKSPVEVGRIVRSFDPCVSCATHVYTNNECIKTIRMVL